MAVFLLQGNKPPPRLHRHAKCTPWTPSPCHHFYLYFGNSKVCSSPMHHAVLKYVQSCSSLGIFCQNTGDMSHLKLLQPGPLWSPPLPPSLPPPPPPPPSPSFRHSVSTNEEEMSPLLCPHLFLLPGDVASLSLSLLSSLCLCFCLSLSLPSSLSRSLPPAMATLTASLWPGLYSAPLKLVIVVG